MVPAGGIDDGLPDEFEAVSPPPDDMESLEQEYHAYMEEVEILSGLDMAFTPDMPEQFAGLTIQEASANDHDDGLVGSDIWITDRYLDSPDSPENFSRYAGILHHEVVHGVQFRNMALMPEYFRDLERSYLTFIHEGQASFNGDDTSYLEIRDLYEELYEQLEDEDDEMVKRQQRAAELLEEFSEDKYMHMFYLEDEEGRIFYDGLVMDRHRAEKLGRDRLYDLAEDTFEGEILRGRGYHVDFRSPLVDTEKIGRHLVDVQNWMEYYYSLLQRENLAMPYAAHANLDL